jgi:hypothetical protein
MFARSPAVKRVCVIDARETFGIFGCIEISRPINRCAAISTSEQTRKSLGQKSFLGATFDRGQSEAENAIHLKSN